MSTEVTLRTPLGQMTLLSEIMELSYVDRQGKLISKEEFNALANSFSYGCVKLEHIGNGVNIYTRWEGKIGNRCWFDDAVMVSKPYVVFRINADETGDLLGEYDNEREALQAHQWHANNERQFQTILRGTSPAVREGAL